MSEIENQEQPLLAAFILEGAPVMYYGELYYDDEHKDKIVFKKALVKAENIEEKTAKWLKIPTAGKDSLVYIDTRTMRGVLVKNIDHKEAAAYKEASLKLYSSLHLAGV
jgi:hypothetical protein